MQRWLSREAKIKDFIQKHITILYLISITFIGGCIRFALIGYVSEDVSVHLRPWLYTI